MFSTGGVRESVINNTLLISTINNPSCNIFIATLTNPICLGLITWSVASGTGTIQSGQGTNSATIQGTGNGNMIIRATANNYIDEKTVHNGVPTDPVQILGIPDNYQGCKNSDFNVYTDRMGNFTWDVIGGQILTGQGTTEIRIRLDNSPGNGFYIGVFESNNCGISSVLGTKQGMIIDCDGGGSTTTRVSPNPTTGQIIIAINPKNIGLSIKEYIIKNKMGKVFAKQKLSNDVNQYSLNIASLPNDIYLIDIFDGKKWNTHKIILQK
jgi:hypothetical protein